MEGKIDNTQKVVYVAELDQDIDDIIAAEYLYRLGVLNGVVLDPPPKEEIGVKRLNILKSKGIPVSETIPEGTEYIFIGGALTAVAKYIRNHTGVKALVMNGGYVGCNIVPFKDQLDKFKNKECVRTFNFNMDINATDTVLRSTPEQIQEIILVGKNVCHSNKNTKLGIWKYGLPREILDEYHSKDEKKQHDMLACREGLVLTNMIEGPAYCEYKDVYPVTEDGLNGNMTHWGSTVLKKNTPYRVVKSAIRFKI